MSVRMIMMIGALALGACSKEPEQAEPANAAANAAAPAKVPHCFFKDSETEKWVVKQDGPDAIVTGRAFRSDARYKAILLDPVINGTVAEIRPSIVINDTGFAAEGNWWDLEAKIPVAGIETIEVRCGKKVLATLPLAKPAAG